MPQGWYWDGIMRRPFSVDEGVEEVFDGVGYQACTYIMDNGRDPLRGSGGRQDDDRTARALAGAERL